MRTKSIYNDMFEEKTIIECYRGSISHNLEIRDKGSKFITDDIDTIKVYRYPDQYYFTLEGYNKTKEVYEKTQGEIDEVAYEIRKAFQLLYSLNPNVTPMLGHVCDLISTVTAIFMNLVFALGWDLKRKYLANINVEVPSAFTVKDIKPITEPV